MKIKYIIGGVVIVIFVVIALVSFNSSKIDYSNFAEAKKSGKIVQIIGERLKDPAPKYDAQANILSFVMRDKEANSNIIIFHGPQPNNFDIAPNLVIKGSFSGNEFHASEILTKCPSKYEGSAEELKKQAVNEK
ncbi:MAG: cytochrome c maturation protein CcmE [Bacteroidota bacterium]